MTAGVSSAEGAPIVEWLVYAVPAQVQAKVVAAASDAGLAAQLFPDIASQRSFFVTSIRADTPPRPWVALGSFSGEILLSLEDKSLRVASVSIGSLPGETSELRLSTWEPDEEDQTERAEMVAALPEKWRLLLDRLRYRLTQVGIAFEDMRAPGFAGPSRSAGASIAIAKPSERSMWVDPIFYSRDFQRRDDLCFVLMPYSPEIQRFYKSAVEPVVQEFELECQLASDITAGQTDIVEDIWIALNEARFLIADLTRQNPNVFYELGIANTLGKRVIAIHKKVPKGSQVRLPFDVHSRRTIFYEDTAAGAEEFKKELRRHIQAILQSRA